MYCHIPENMSRFSEREAISLFFNEGEGDTSTEARDYFYSWRGYEKNGRNVKAKY